MLLQIVRKRQHAVLKSWQHSGTKPTDWQGRFSHRSAIETGPIQQNETRPRVSDRRHNGPSLTRLRHVWYQDAVDYDARYDSHYFVRSGEWVEPKCPDPLCAQCNDRPRRYAGPPIPEEVPDWLAIPSDVQTAERAGG
jgi:hypothetical protein